MFKIIKIWVDSHINLITVIAIISAGGWALFEYSNKSILSEFDIHQKVQTAEKSNFILTNKLSKKSASLEKIQLQIVSRIDQISTADRTIKTINENTKDKLLKEQQLHVTYNGRNRTIESVNKLKDEENNLISEIQSIEFQIKQNYILIESFK